MLKITPLSNQNISNGSFNTDSSDLYIHHCAAFPLLYSEHQEHATKYLQVLIHKNYMSNVKDTVFALSVSPVSRKTVPDVSSTSTLSGSISSALSQNFTASSKLKLSKHSSTYLKNHYKVKTTHIYNHTSLTWTQTGQS